MNRPENFNKIDEVAVVNEKDDGTVFANRFGSSRRNSTMKARHSVGTVNAGFIEEEDNKIMQEAVDIIGDLPALHLEHCKL